MIGEKKNEKSGREIDGKLSGGYWTKGIAGSGETAGTMKLAGIRGDGSSGECMKQISGSTEQLGQCAFAGRKPGFEICRRLWIRIVRKGGTRAINMQMHDPNGVEKKTHPPTNCVSSIFIFISRLWLNENYFWVHKSHPKLVLIYWSLVLNHTSV